MNDIEKSAAEKKKAGRWALEAIVPALLILGANFGVLEVYIRVERHSGNFIVPLVASAIFVWAAFYWVMARLKGGSSH